MIAVREFVDRPASRNIGERRTASVVQHVIEYVDANYGESISLRHVADALGYSPCHLTHTFRQATGLPVTAWIIRRRIDAARALLACGHIDVATACERVGFNDLCYFTRQFVRHVGTTPGRFRAAAMGRPIAARRDRSC